MSIVLQTKGTAPAFVIAEAVSCLLANFLYCVICYAFLLRRYSQISAVSIIAPNPASAIPMVLLISSIPRITLSDEGVVVGVSLTVVSAAVVVVLAAGVVTSGVDPSSSGEGNVVSSSETVVSSSETVVSSGDVSSSEVVVSSGVVSSSEVVVSSGVVVSD